MLQAKAQNYESEVVSIKILTANHNLIEVVAKFISQDQQVLRVENPQSLVSMPGNKPGEESNIGMVNFMVSGDQTKIVELNRSLVMGLTLAKKEAVDAYKSLTSNVQQVKGPGLIV